jgi:hypothetical protein
MKKKLILIGAIFTLLLILFYTNPSSKSMYENLSKEVNANPGINLFFAQTEVEKEQGIKNNIINYQIVYKDFKLFSIGEFRSSFTDSNFDYNTKSLFESMNEKYDNKIVSIGIFGHVFVLNGLNDLINEYNFDVNSHLKIPLYQPLASSRVNEQINFWDYFNKNKNGLKIGEKFKDGYVLYLLRENDNIQLFKDSTHKIIYNKDTVHGILIKKLDESENIISPHNPKRIIPNFNQFKIGNAVINTESLNLKLSEGWVIPTLDELYLIYLAKNTLNEIQLDGVYPSSSLSPAPYNGYYGLWLRDMNNNNIYFDPWLSRKIQILVKYF